MKLIEKKCPNCGASLSFDSTDKEVTCKYCNVSFEIEREISDYIDTEKIGKLANDILNPETFNLHRKMVNNFSKIFIFVWAFIFIIALVMFFLIASRVLPGFLG